jgi:hypothetical protein
MAKRNFLLGRGERLTTDVVIRSGGAEKIPPYSVSEAKTRLTPMIRAAVEALDAIPAAAAPGEKVVATLTLNPEYIAKSYFPAELLKTVGLEAVGSRPRLIKPEKKSRARTRGCGHDATVRLWHAPGVPELGTRHHQLG